MNGKSGLALQCNIHGIITDILHNPPELKLCLQVGKLFTHYAAPGSLAKALTFLAEIRAQSTAFEREINITVSQDQVKTFRFMGSLVDESMLIVGSEDGAIARRLYEGMMHINNEQSNTMRHLLKQKCRDDTLYNELSYLNNELVAMQREITKKNAELERLNQEKNRFLGMAAHDLRNPLHTILSYSDFLLLSNNEPPQQEFLQVIRDVSQFMARLVDNLLDISKIEAGDLQLDYEPVNLTALINNNAAINRPLAAQKQIEISYHLDETLPTALVDSAKLEQVLNNLISNAIKFSEPGSTVQIKLERTGDNFLISIADKGAGIAPEQKGRLFQPFQRGQKGTEGEESVGLGLTIAKRIVEGHGGQLWFESDLGVGTTFFIVIPLQPPIEGDRIP